MYEDYMDNLFDRRPMPTVAPKVGDIFLYTVNRGDNVYAIARRFNTRVRDGKEAKDMKKRIS